MDSGQEPTFSQILMEQIGAFSGSHECLFTGLSDNLDLRERIIGLDVASPSTCTSLPSSRTWLAPSNPQKVRIFINNRLFGPIVR